MQPLNHNQAVRECADHRLPPVDAGFAFHFAAEYFDRGWSILPLIGKRPGVSSWRKYQSTRPSLDKLRKWFSNSKMNLGVVTGSISGLVVVDCDTPDDARFWKEKFPETPLAVWTGGGGTHYYYRYPQAHKVFNRAGLLTRRIDLRADGGYVVAPPSCHLNGNFYRWHGTHEYCLDDVPYFSPEWIATDLKSTSAVPGRIIQRPRSYIRSIVAISGQHGHNQTFRAACKLRDAGLTPEEALCELVIWNQTNASPPWSIRELLHKVQSAYQLQAKHGTNSGDGSHG
jgi:hypothetical protein